jgi:hypothetical protein
MSLNHSDDTVKLLSLLQTIEIINRRNVHFNERFYPARKQKLNPSHTHADTGEDLLAAWSSVRRRWRDVDYHRSWHT